MLLSLFLGLSILLYYIFVLFFYKKRTKEEIKKLGDDNAKLEREEKRKEKELHLQQKIVAFESGKVSKSKEIAMEYLKRAVCFFFFSLSFITIIYFYFYVDHSREVVLISLPYLAVFLLLAIFNFLRASEITVNEKNTLPPLSILYSNLPVYALAFFTTFAMIVNSDRGFGAIGTMLMACILAVLYTIITFVWYFFASKPMIGYENTLQNIFGFLLLAIVSSIPFISFLTSWTW